MFQIKGQYSRAYKNFRSNKDDCTAVQHCNAICECTAFDVSFNKFTIKKRFQ